MHFKVDGATCDDGGRTEVSTYTGTDWGGFEPEHREFYHTDNHFLRDILEWKGVLYFLCELLNCSDLPFGLWDMFIHFWYIKFYSRKIIYKCLKFIVAVYKVN